MRLAAAAAALLLAFATAGPVAPAGAAAEDDGPALATAVDELRAALRCPPARKGGHEPVLLVPGVSQTGLSAWSWNYTDALAAQGYDACTLDLPAFATGDVQLSAEYVVQAVRDLAAGGKVDVVTFSSGALDLRWALSWWPGLRGAVDDAILLGGANHGTTVADWACSSSCVAALWQSRPGSAFLTALDVGDATPGAASWTNVYSGTDEIVLRLGEDDPWAAAAELDGATNIRVQDVCPGRLVEHVGHLYDAQVHRLVLDALANPGPAEPARAGEVCGQVTMPGVELWDAAAQSGATAANFAARTNENKVAAEPAVADYARP